MGFFKSKRSQSGHYRIDDIDTANTSHRRSIKKDADNYRIIECAITKNRYLIFQVHFITLFYQRRKSTASGGFETDSHAGTTLERRASQRGHNSQPNSTPNSQYKMFSNL